ncbi:S8 family peptidase [Rossellomorea sp. YZS02]|uniref:S8 family peptidase n=1 Tax=Rossellomorea sp. YZS02 TaxID=3097358 RepID=UPI002A0FB6FB|nr:S8 family serine peptidase [Rossellomorea sp. YZS02]MDX8343171.1 S8 family serine peptidase [Rossellomorea sp. YZS02]
MRKTYFLLLLFLLIIPLQGQAETSVDDYILIFKDDINWDLLQSQHVQIIDTYSSISSVAVKTDKSIADKLVASPDILGVQVNHSYEIQTQKVPRAFNPLNITPEIRTGLTGKGIKIGVLDTGIDSQHPDLKVSGGVCVLQADCTMGFMDDNGHGTHVAGVISAVNNDIGTVGVAPEAEIFAIKALDSTGGGTTTTILSGIEWAIKNDIDLVNMSITTKDNDLALKTMIDRAYQSGILIVGAAGNNGTAGGTEDNLLYPAKYPSVIAVGAINDKEQRVSTSATGKELELMAPGYNIYSTVPLNADIFDGSRDGYAYMTGTSMAVPYVTGILALYKEQFPTYSNQQVRDLLTGSAKDLGVEGKDSQFGYGLVQMKDLRLNIPEGNDVVPTVTNGKVTFMIYKSEDVKKIEVKRSDRIEVSAIKDDTWDDYLPTGSYEYTFYYTFDDNSTYLIKRKINVSSPSFYDLVSTQWFSTHMIYLNVHGILNGFNDGGLHPYQNITRGEALALVGRIKELDPTMRETVFKDIEPSYFASGYIQSAYETKLIKGFSDLTFKPSQYVTRAEMAILVANAYQLGSQNPTHFLDVSESMSGYKQIGALVESDITKGYTDGTFRPHRFITRAEFSVFLARAEEPDFK